jgi:hypothetical protein
MFICRSIGALGIGLDAAPQPVFFRLTTATLTV